MINITIPYAHHRPAEELKRKLGQFNNFVNFNTRNPNEDVDKVRNNAYAHVKEIIRLSEYALLICGDGTYRRSNIERINREAKIMLTALLDVETIDDIKSVTAPLLREYESKISELNNLRDWMKSTRATHLTSNDTHMYHLAGSTLQAIVSTITVNKNNLTIFSPQCGDGANEKAIADMLKHRYPSLNVKTYGLEEEGNGVADAKTKLTKVIKGGLRGATISNEVFDMVFLNPRITVNTSMKEDGKLYDTNEDVLLKNSLRYLKDGGLFVYTIPYYALTPSMKLYLSKWLQDYVVLQQYDTNQDSRNEMKFITIMGRKEYNPSYSDTFTALGFLNYETLNKDTTIKYELNLQDAEIKLFRGSVLDDEEIDSLIMSDGLYEEFFKDVQYVYDAADTRPLLPFNIGQIGLILSSGSLDGVVEEANGVKHVIKGMTVKESDTVTESSVDARGNAITESTTTVRNKVQISAFGADGQFYNLA